MNVALAFDCSCAQIAVAVAVSAAEGETEIRAHHREPLERGHAARLIPAIDEVLRQASCPITEIDLIAVTVGPGSFTGVRIGLATARALSLAIGKPLAGYTTLDVLLAAARHAGLICETVVAAIDTRRGDSYLLLSSDAARPFVGGAEELAAMLLPERTTVVGDHAVAIARSLADKGIGVGVEPSIRLPDASVMARLALADGGETWAARNRREGPPRAFYLRAAAAHVPAGPKAGFSAPGDEVRMWLTQPIRLSDLDRAADLYADAFDHQSAGRLWTRQDFADLLPAAGVYAFLLLRNGESCGLALARHVADEAELLAIGVRPQVRRRGGASRLLDEVVMAARDRGADHLNLEVAEDNAAARAFYVKHRFRELGRRAGYYSGTAGRSIAAIVMRRDIAEG